MKKEKKPLTIKQEIKKDRAIQYATFGGEFVSIATPYAIMAGVNHKEWFIENPEPWKLGLGGALGLALLSMSILLVSKKKEKESLTDGYIALIIGWFAVAFIFLLLARVMNEIYTIMFYGGIGLLGAFGLDQVSKVYKRKADDKKLAMNKAHEELDKEKAKQEIKETDKQEKKVRF